MQEPIVNPEAPVVPAAEPAVVPQVVAPVAQGDGGAATETVNPYKEFGFETPEALLEDYKTLRDYKEKVPQLEQKLAEVSSRDPFATPALKVVNDYQQRLVESGVTDPKELSRLSSDMLHHLQTNYSEVAATNPAMIIEMMVRAEYDGIEGITEDEIADEVHARTYVAEPAKPSDPDDPDEVDAYNAKMRDYKTKMSSISRTAKAHAAKLEEGKQKLDFTPRVSPEAQQAETTRKAAFDRLTDQILGYKIPDTIEIAGKQVPIQNTPELQQLVAQMGKEPFKAIHDFIGVKDGVPDFNKLMKLALIVNNLPALTAHIEAKALDSATRAVEGNLDGSARGGSGQAAAQQALSKEEKAKKAVGFLFGG